MISERGMWLHPLPGLARLSGYPGITSISVSGKVDPTECCITATSPGTLGVSLSPGWLASRLLELGQGGLISPPYLSTTSCHPGLPSMDCRMKGPMRDR